jgi:acyl dehydratase
MTGRPEAANRQRYHEDVRIGEELAPVEFPLTVYRLVMSAGASRDFNSIHHNSEYARGTGAAEMYANGTFLLGMWERAVRDWIGAGGTIRAIRGFRMRAFNYVGDTTTVRGRVRSIDDASTPSISIEVWSEISSGVTVGPGTVEVTLPSRGTEEQR